MLVKSARAIELHWTTEPLVWAAGEAIEVPDSLVPMLLPLGGFTVRIAFALRECQSFGKC